MHPVLSLPLVLVLVLSPFATQIRAQQASSSQDQVLTQQCLDSFDMIKNQDLDAFVARMPYQPSAKEREYAGEILQRSHKRWYLDRTMDEITPKGVIYSKADESKRQKGAILEARVKLLITSSNKQASVSCKFVETAEGWFLSKLP